MTVRTATRRALLTTLLLLGLAAVSPFGAPNQFEAYTDERVVEGHTVFSVMERVSDIDDGFSPLSSVSLPAWEPEARDDGLSGAGAWSMATLVRERFTAWGLEEVRYPCFGYVLATWDGLDPEVLVTTLTASDFTYIESYYVTDPNGFAGSTHLYAVDIHADRVPLWVTDVHGDLGGFADDGVTNCPTIFDFTVHDEVPYHDGGDDVPYRHYNTLMFGRMIDVVPVLSGVKEHGDGGAHASDVAGCAAGSEWECPGDDDDAEGNSHGYDVNYGNAGPVHDHDTAALEVRFMSQLGGLTTQYPPSLPSYVYMDFDKQWSGASPCPVRWFNNAC